jgi:hypothetical protein
MTGFIRKRHFFVIARTFGIRVALRALMAPRGATFLSILY